jgi:hypothetical protein
MRGGAPLRRRPGLAGPGVRRWLCVNASRLQSVDALSAARYFIEDAMDR